MINTDAYGHSEKEPEYSYFSVMGIIVATAGLYFSYTVNYLLFHSLVELATITIAFFLSILTWNTRRLISNGSLKALGIGYGLIAGIDLIHTLVYKGMGVFPGSGANLPTQLWIAARSLQAVLLFTAPLFARRNISEKIIFAVCLASVSGMTALVFSGVFPDCFIEGRGLTSFKIISEYVISAILLLAMVLFIVRRAAFSRRIFLLIVISILCTLGSELAFTAYLNVYSPSNMAGHFLKLAAFYLIYRALIVTGLKEPFELIFRELRQSQESLTQQREFNRSLLESMTDGVVACDHNGTLTLFNRTSREWHGLDPMQLPPEEWARHYDLFRADGETPLPTDEIPLAMAFRGEEVRDTGMAIMAAGQAPRFILANGSEIKDSKGQKLGAVVVMHDITSTRRLEQELREINKDLEMRVSERTASLEESEKRYRIVADNTYDWEFWINPEGLVLYNSPSCQRITGLTADEFERDPDLFYRIIHPEDLERFKQHRKKVMGEKMPGNIEYRIILPDAGTRYIGHVCQPVFDEKGQYLGKRGSNRDITERRLAEEALQREQTLLNRIMVTSPVGITVVSKQGQVTFANPLAEKIMGLSREEIAMRTYNSPEWHIEDIDGGPFPDEELPFNRVMSVRRPVFDVQHAITWPDGHRVLLSISGAPIFDSQGEIESVVFAIEDITRRRTAEEELRRNEQRYRMAQAIGHVGNWEYDIRTTQFWGSDEAKRIYGFDPEQHDFSTEEVERCIPERERVHQALVDLIEKGKPYNLEFEIHPRDSSGPRIIASIADVQRDDEGNPQMVMGVIHDITERKQAEEEIRKLYEELEQRVRDRTAQLEAANKEMESFTYSVSHDLRAPLRHINSFMELLKRRMTAEVDQQSRHYMSTISESANKMGILIDNLLSFSRIGRREIYPVEVEIDELVRDVIRELEQDISGRVIEWRIGEIPPIYGDPSMLRVVLSNLIANAVKFTRPRERARIEIGMLSGEDSETVVFVRDNGVGFDPAYAGKLFNVFQRLHRTDEFEGTGVGLAIAQRIILRHGGRIWGEGELGKGAAFYFSLPLSIRG